MNATLPARSAASAASRAWRIRQERRGPTQSKWIALGALAFGAIPGALAYLIVPHWLAFVVVTLLAGGAAYQVWREMVAHVKIIDRGDWPNK